MATIIEIHPSSVTTIFWTHVSLCCENGRQVFGYSLENIVNSKRNLAINDL